VCEEIVAALRARLHLLAARFVLPGRGPDVDGAIGLACDLIVHGMDTPATVEVAALSYGSPLRDAEPMMRDMLSDHGIPAAGPGASESERFQIVLRAFRKGGLGVGEFSAAFYAAVPVWDDQNQAERSLVLLLDDWEHEATAVGRAEITAAMRRQAMLALGEDAG
jgi:hypothetical protein